MDLKNIPYYFDEEQKIFHNCSSKCQTYNGILDSNCLSCSDINNFLYKGKCYYQCPDKTYPDIDNFGNRICKNCHQNCETCQSSGNNNYMNCSTCSGNFIYFTYNHIQNLKDCYLIKDNITKTFFSPDNETISCKNFNKYIEEDAKNCIDELKEGYYI